MFHRFLRTSIYKLLCAGLRKLLHAVLFVRILGLVTNVERSLFRSTKPAFAFLGKPCRPYGRQCRENRHSAMVHAGLPPQGGAAW